MIEIQNLIHQFRNTQDFQLIYKIISRAFDLLWFYPIYSIYFIAFITFILNIPKISIEIIELGLTFDDMFEPLLELKKEVQDLLNGLEGEGQVPLLENNELSAKMKGVVRTIFLRYVKPGTRKMDINGLQHFITTTNKGVTPPREFVEHVFYNFAEGNGRNIAISIDGFEAFYLNLALSDPTETRQDLSQHGFEPSFLESTNEMDATRARIDKLSLH
ncbi:hypothetical protein K502DRAFT_285415 [Neoconidiobolus thromboides FSU 785]|nr:hypothetical protein K502DRAFT_285415 [Neoconidiobolus thromboides FSU 785]